MSTNYYAHINLGGPVVKLHIGKSSFGWCFGLHVTDEIRSLDDWRKIWAQAFVTIVDECGDKITPEVMLATITQRSHPSDHAVTGLLSKIGVTANVCDDAWYARNHATRGPKNLARQTHNAAPPPDPRNDTYTLISGDFS